MKKYLKKHLDNNVIFCVAARLFKGDATPKPVQR